MGHLVSKDIYKQLGKKIDGLSARVPWNQTLHAVLKELYTEEEADLAVKMPYGLSTEGAVARQTGLPKKKVSALLENMAQKGLVLDLYLNGKYRFQLSPMVIGIFEFTMMRTRGELNIKEWAELFREYFFGSRAFYESNAGKISILRSLPYTEALDEQDYVEVLDYEKAASIVDQTQKIAVGICACRHAKHHLGEKKCDVPLESCTSFDTAADFIIRRGFGKEISKAEMHDLLAQSKDFGLVLNADNVQKRVSFICHCCGCCCEALAGIHTHGFENVVVTSNYIANIDASECTGCGQCAKACPINAINMLPCTDPRIKTGKMPKLDEKFCLGCGVCALACKTQTLKLKKRKQRVLHPETTFERILLQCLERGTLQNLLFTRMDKKTHAFMRGLIGGFLRLPPVKQSLMSDALRSRFLETMQNAVRKQGKGFVSEV